MATTTNIYSTKDYGQVIFAGNTLGLTGVGANDEGFLNFTTANVPPPSGGTTTDWTQNSSASMLALPAGATVLHAELMWGTCLNLRYDPSLVPFANDPINFTDPKGVLSHVTPRTDTARDYNYGIDGYYIARTATVTNLVSAGGAGFYTVGHIPCVLSNPAGGIEQENLYSFWTLFVAYRNAGESFRNLNIYYFGGGNVPGHVVLNNIQTPPTGPIDGHLLLSVGNGNSTRDGDSVWFGPTDATLTQLSTPNNLPNNFFASQVNDRNGVLDTTGTWGNKNTIPGSKPVIGNREYCDTTGVDVSSEMLNNQTSAVLDIRSIASDGLAILGGALQTLEQEFPTLPQKSVTPTEITAAVGGTVNYSVNYYISPETAYAPSSVITIEDIVSSDLTVTSSSLSLPASSLYTITNLSVGNHIKYQITTNVPVGQFLPPKFTMSITATYAPSNIEYQSPIPNTATMTVNSDQPLVSNTVYVFVNTPRTQAITDIYESVALEQTALSHIINAEGEKIQKAVQLNLSTTEMLMVNKSVENMLNSITLLDSVLKNKMDLFGCDVCF